MRSLIISTSTLLAAFTSTASSGEFAFQPISFGDSSTTALQVSSDGSVVVGYWSDSNGVTAIRWTSQGGTESLFEGAAQAVSPDGKLIVGSSGSRPVYWTQEAGLAPLTGFSPDSGFGTALAVSNTGTVYGVHDNPDGTRSAFSWTASAGPVFLKPIDGFENTSVNAVSNDDQVAVGSAYFAPGAGFAVRWSEDNASIDFGFLPVQRYASTALDVSPDGRVIVGQAVSEAYRWDAVSGIIGLGDLAGGQFYSEARSIAGYDGTIVGRGTDAQGAAAFIWNGAAGMIGLAELLQRQGVTEFANWHSTVATSISDDGRRIVGYGVNLNGVRTGWVVDLPAQGDATFDNIVDGADYVAWADHFLQADTNWSQGDFNFDGKTDAIDYVIWADHFAPSQAVSISIVPEPSPQLLMLIGAVLIAMTRHHSRRLSMVAK